MTRRSWRARGVALFGVALALMLHTAPAGTAAPPPRLITLDADRASLPEILKILAEKGDLNIITGPGVASGQISIRMRDVPVDQAVNLVVRAAGLAYERIGNSVIVADSKSLKEETGLSSYVIPLKFADALEVKDALQKLSADIEVDRGGNRLIVVSSPRVISEIQSIVDQLDVPARQVMLEARIVEVSTDDAKTLGIDWDLLNRQTFIIVEGTPAPSPPDRPPPLMPYVPTGQPVELQRQAKAIQVAIDLLLKEGNARCSRTRKRDAQRPRGEHHRRSADSVRDLADRVRRRRGGADAVDPARRGRYQAQDHAAHQRRRLHHHGDQPRSEHGDRVQG